MTIDKTVLTTKSISYTYPGRDKPAVESVSFSLNSGEYLAVLGSNGSGKSTLARLICGYLMPDSGEIESLAEITGIVFQSPRSQIVASVVVDDISFGPENLKLSPGEIELRTVECLGVIGLLDRYDYETSALSLGQTQKLAFAGILALYPDLLVLDESVSMIDPASRQKILNFLDSWNKKGHAIIHVTHDFDEALRAQRIILMDKGCLVFDGSVNDFQNTPELVSLLFGSPLELLRDEFPTLYSPIIRNTDDSLVFKSLTFSYPESTPLFSDLSLNIKRGTLTAFMGETGSGKSTLLELASGLLTPQSGSVCCATRPVLALQECEGALFEQFAADDVAFGPRNYGVSGKTLVERVKSSMQCVSLPFTDFAERQTSTLSGGEKRKLSLAGIIALDSEVMLFDEPTAGLDSHSRRQVMETLCRLCSLGKTIVFSTHREDEAAIASRIITLNKGEVISDTWSDVASPAQKEQPCVNEADPIVGEQPPVLEKLPGVNLLSSLRHTGFSFKLDKKAATSLIGKMPPLAKYLVFIILFCSALCMPTLALSCASIIASLCYVFLSRVSLIKLIKSILKLFPWLLIFFLFQIVLTPVSPGDTVYIGYRFFSVTDAKLLFGARMFLRVISAYLCLSVFLRTITQREVISGMKTLLRPLELIHIPVRYIVLLTTIVFRFLPLLNEEAIMIVKTQLVRGGLQKTKGLINRVRSLLPLFIPLVLQTLKRASAMADALVARHFS